MVDPLSIAESAFVGNSPAICSIRQTLAKVDPSMATVLGTGESGTSKEVIGRLIHRCSARPFVVVNCPALPMHLQEADLFGRERRVATEVDSRTGLLETVDGGTVLLDEIDDRERLAEAKTLRFVQETTIERVGGRKVLSLDLRLLAATHHDLHELIEQGRFASTSATGSTPSPARFRLLSARVQPIPVGTGTAAVPGVPPRASDAEVSRSSDLRPAPFPSRGWHAVPALRARAGRCARPRRA